MKIVILEEKNTKYIYKETKTRYSEQKKAERKGHVALQMNN